MGWLNDKALSNIAFIFFTLETFHLFIGLLNDEACANIAYMLVTLDTFQLLIS